MNKTCKIEGCEGKLSDYNKTGMCGFHSARAAKNLPLVAMTCTAENCGQKGYEGETLFNGKCHQHHTFADIQISAERQAS